ncbi:FAD-dependent oxidoreductase [Draconibacterium sp. IB214405]|uniref:ferredoxin--NADP reductase n=1 Tax=Draconibacterium sp. IB214405 TaxID=3097352 RepID=UPI002A1802BE|nr:FAD-dependent oxidoreductase [Draconibacterium sp. IB214405]MDX8337659.1 FAD-dependent oxidoreductase [Draconibacterium sp. IB214405]
MSARTKKEPPLIRQVVTNNEEISPGVHVISFRRNFDFLPGQVVKIGVDTEHPPRIYSICSGNQEDELRILFNIKDDGFLTPKMAAMIPGDILFVSEPYGSFLGTNDPAWWIATGTGIAPFYAMFRSGNSENKTLIHGVRHLNQFYFEDELEWSLGKNYVRCCSQEESCDVFPGRVSKYLEELDELPDVKFYLCGKALMVVEVRDLLIEKGVDYGNIIAEIYF